MQSAETRCKNEGGGCDHRHAVFVRFKDTRIPSKHATPIVLLIERNTDTGLHVLAISRLKLKLLSSSFNHFVTKIHWGKSKKGTYVFSVRSRASEMRVDFQEPQCASKVLQQGNHIETEQRHLRWLSKFYSSFNLGS